MAALPLHGELHRLAAVLAAVIGSSRPDRASAGHLVPGPAGISGRAGKDRSQEEQLRWPQARCAIVPAELQAIRADDWLNVVLLDMRSEAGFNLFPPKGARRSPLDQGKAVVTVLLQAAAGQDNRVLARHRRIGRLPGVEDHRGQKWVQSLHPE